MYLWSIFVNCGSFLVNNEVGAKVSKHIFWQGDIRSVFAFNAVTIMIPLLYDMSLQKVDGKH